MGLQLAAPDLPLFLPDSNEAGSAIDERLAITTRPREAEDSFSTMIAAAENYDWTENESHGPDQDKERESNDESDSDASLVSKDEWPSSDYGEGDEQDVENHNWIDPHRGSNDESDSNAPPVSKDEWPSSGRLSGG